MTGRKILHYEILEKLGEGGMGVVYKARDTTLDRIVAMKFLPAHLMSSPDDRTRFEREAKAAAALTHANIATIFEINEYENSPFFVMEFVEGATLKERLNSGMLTLRQAVSIALQLAEGLKAAHAKNIVHRDIKSPNVILGEDGQVKILDFGLAKTTMATLLTKAGSTLGTVAYMSPEQVKGHPVDHRTDLWSLGVIFYEMLTGRLPFAGDYDQVIFYKILNEEPEPVTSLRSGIPMALEWIITKLLAKDPDNRYQSANDLIIDLKSVDLKTNGFSKVEHPGGIGGQKTKDRVGEVLRHVVSTRVFRRAVLAALFILTALVSALIAWKMHPDADRTVRKFRWPSEYTTFVLSPDGKKIAYMQREKLWFRYLDKAEPVEITAEDVITNILWSPGSDYIVYFTGITSESHQLKKVSLSGVHSLITKTKGNYFPRYWGRDDSILVTSWDENGWNMLLKVPASGGELVPMYGGDSARAMIKGDLAHVCELPDGRTLLLCLNKGKGEIFAQTSEARTVIYTGPPESNIAKIAYSNAGYLLYTMSPRGGALSDLWAASFDPSSARITGEHFLVARNAGLPSVAENGMLSYIDNAGSGGSDQLVLVSRSGQIERTISQPQLEIHSPSLSPDGRTIATMSADDAGMYGIYLHDIAKGTKSQLSFDVPEPWKPVWSPNGKEIVFQSGYFETGDLLRLPADERSSPVPVVNSKQFESDPSWSHDGRFILYAKLESRPVLQSDLWYLEVGKGEEPKQLFTSPFNEDYPALSPDGRFVSFQSDKSGRMEVYVTNFPQADRQWQISNGGGIYPQWADDEILFMDPKENLMMSSRVRLRPGFQAEKPIVLFSAEKAGVQLLATHSFKYTATRDGKNIIAVKRLGQTKKPDVVVVEHWSEEFRNRQASH